MKKPRSDSKLKNLPPARQEQIIEWCAEGYEHARKQLAKDGLRVSNRALGEFYSWYRLRSDFAAAEQSAATATELMREFDPTDAEKAEAFGQFVFTQAAIAAKDAETFVRMQSLKLSQDSARTKAELEREKLHISRQRLLLDKARAQLLRIAEQGLTETNKDGVAALIAEMERLGVRG